MTGNDIKNAVDLHVTNVTQVKGISNINLGNDIKDVVDFVVQEKADLDNRKVEKISGFGLSKNDFTDILKAKLDSITAIFTTALKTTYDNTSSSLSTLLGTGQRLITSSEITKLSNVGSQIKTTGQITATNSSGSDVVLSYDFNEVYATISNNVVVLPTTTDIGKEVLIFALNNANYINLKANQAGTSRISTTTNGISVVNSTLQINANDIYRAIHRGAGYWYCEKI
jgi:hypothetical protein